MAEAVASDPRSQQIIADVISTLEGLRIDGRTMFTSVVAVDDPESFIRVADPLTAKDAAAGVVEGAMEQRDGSDDTEEAVVKMSIQIIARFNMDRKPGAGENAAMAEARRITQAVRNELVKDRSRGGKTNLISFGGAVINGTDVSGSARLLTRLPNNGFYSVSIPIAVGWSIFS